MPKQHDIGARVKVATAVVGTGVVVTMGALTVVFGGDEALARGPHLGGAGSTVTQSTAPTSILTPVATPVLTTKMWHK
jgi:hypothetical protein